MPYFSLRLPLQWMARLLLRGLSRLDPSWRGVQMFPPGHFYSPLLDLRDLPSGGSEVRFDGAEYWAGVDLQPERLRAGYQALLQAFPEPHFPEEAGKRPRYRRENDFFPFADAFTLSAMIRREKPRRIVEVGSGFSSAALVDTILEEALPTQVVCIEPSPERLLALISPAEAPFLSVRRERVQEVPLAVFEELQAGDFLFIDSSHVAKIGSDLSFLFLRVLPRLQPGVLLHFHDIFYPFSYPPAWVREGRAWNESLILRAMLANSHDYEVIAFNSFAGATFPELFREAVPGFLPNAGGSLWLRKLR